MNQGKSFSEGSDAGAIVNMAAPETAPIGGTRNHAYQPLFTTFRIIDRLPPARSNILSMSHCVLMALGHAREGTRTPMDFSTRS
jgi:hypothetical protein